MWADNETSEDLLGFKVHADLLIDVINDDIVLPVTIGVFGDWGSGKSSILQIINKHFEDDPDTLCIYFNGWTFEGYDDAKAALLNSILKELEDNKKLSAEVVSTVKEKAKKLWKSIDWMRGAGMVLKNIALPAVSAYFTGGISLAPYAIKKISELGIDSPEKLIEKLQSADGKEFFESIRKEEEKEEKTNLISEFRKDFSELLEATKFKKLVVIIDDLDRCAPDRIIENLEAVKLFLNVSKTAFIIGADPRIVRHAIEHRYKTDSIENADDSNSRNKRIVSDYLEKLIQVPYILPKLSDSEVETYMTLLFCKKVLGDDFNKVHNAFCSYRDTNRYAVYGFGDIQSLLSDEEKTSLSESVSLIASLSSVISEGLNGNPRQIKRFLNTFTLRNRLVKVAKIQDFKVDILAKLMVLEYSNPELFRKIYEWQIGQKGEPKELIELEKLVAQGKFEEIKVKYTIDWASEKIIRWLKINPSLTGVDLRDYYWISRDQLSNSMSGASLVPPHIRSLFKKLIGHGSGTILTNTITQEIIGKLSELENEVLLSQLEKELSKVPENVITHRVFIELMSQKVIGAIESYIRVLTGIDHSKIPFSLQNEFKIAVKSNEKIGPIFTIFKKESQISKALNQK
jgi:hypothetical protein